LFASNRKGNTVVPQTEVSAVDLQGLLGASKCFSEFFLGMVATCKISPGVGVSLIKVDACSKAENGLIPIFKLHISTSAGEPLFGEKQIYCES
jgi:hypothetical protein